VAFVAVGTLAVLIFSAIDYVFSCVQCVLLVDWLCFANVLWCCEFEIAHNLFRCVLELRCGWVGVVSVWKASAFHTDTTPTNRTNILRIGKPHCITRS